MARCSKYLCTLALACSAALREARFGASPSPLSSLSLSPSSLSLLSLLLFSSACTLGLRLSFSLSLSLLSSSLIVLAAKFFLFSPLLCLTLSTLRITHTALSTQVVLRPRVAVNVVLLPWPNVGRAADTISASSAVREPNTRLAGLMLRDLFQHEGACKSLSEPSCDASPDDTLSDPSIRSSEPFDARKCSRIISHVLQTSDLISSSMYADRTQFMNNFHRWRTVL